MSSASLAPDHYARGHALFEARSDQRTTIIGWLGARLAQRAGADRFSVLSVGCGDGTVDRALAVRACAEAPPGSTRSWTGLDPHAPGVASFVAGLERVRDDGAVATTLEVDGRVGTLEDVRAAPGERFDVVVFVHSLYYVPDLRAALERALSLLAPGGEVLVLHAPLGALNLLAAEHAPAGAAGAQPWSDAVTTALTGLGATATTEDLTATIDLAGCEEDDPALLDFVVQAVLAPAARRAVAERLRDVAGPEGGLRVAHPVTAFVVRPEPGAAVLRSGA